MPTSLLAMYPSGDASNQVSMVFREVYASQATNWKSGAFYHGVYKGFLLSTSGSNLSVTLQADPFDNDHVAMYRMRTGNSPGATLTVRYYNSGTPAITLSLAAYTNQTVVIAINASYQLNTATTANINAYTVAEYNALTSDQQNELVVLGTVVVPNSGLIGASSITSTRRTQARAQAWPYVPVTENGSFELIGGGSTSERASWVRNNTDGSRGVFDYPASVTPPTGKEYARVRWTTVDGSTTTNNITQYVELWCNPFDMFRIRCQQKVLTQLSAGSIDCRLIFRLSGGGTSNVDTSIQTTATVTAGAFSLFEAYALAPSTAIALQAVQIRCNAANITAMAPADVLLIDDVEVALQNYDGVRQYLPIQKLREAHVTETQTLDMIGTSSPYPTIRRWFNSSSGDGEIYNDDLNTSERPRFNVPGRLRVGYNYTNDDTHGDKPRIETAIRTTANKQSLVRYASGGSRAVREYVNSNGFLGIAVNAAYASSTGQYTADDNANPAAYVELDWNAFSLQFKASTGSAWSSWDSPVLSYDTTGAIRDRFKIATTSDAAHTYTMGDGRMVVNDSTVSADRVWSLSRTGAAAGDQFLVTADIGGTHQVSVEDLGNPATSLWTVGYGSSTAKSVDAEFYYTGSAWKLLRAGAPKWLYDIASSSGANQTKVVADIATLKAINTTSTTSFPEGYTVCVPAIGVYTLTRTTDASASTSEPWIVVPTTGTGRWMLTGGHYINATGGFPVLDGSAKIAAAQTPHYFVGAQGQNDGASGAITTASSSNTYGTAASITAVAGDIIYWAASITAYTDDSSTVIEVAVQKSDNGTPSTLPNTTLDVSSIPSGAGGTPAYTTQSGTFFNFWVAAGSGAQSVQWLARRSAGSGNGFVLRASTFVLVIRP